MVEITSEIPPSGFQSSSTPPDVLQASLSSTDIPVTAGGDKGTTVARHGHTLRWVLVGTAVAVGLGLGIGLSQSGGGGKRGTTNPNPVDNRVIAESNLHQYDLAATAIVALARWAGTLRPPFISIWKWPFWSR